MFPVVSALHATPGVNASVCVTAQHRGMLDQVLEIAGITPDFDLDLMTPDQTLDELLAKLVARLGARAIWPGAVKASGAVSGRRR